MKSIIGSLISAAITLALSACGASESAAKATLRAMENVPKTASKTEIVISSEVQSDETEEIIDEEQKEEDTMKITVGDKVFTAKLADNSSAEALKELLKNGDLAIDMHDYGNFEKVGDIGTSLPQNNEQITTVPGDIILYLGTSITIYYDTNSWNFTRLGKIQNATQKELKEALGKGNVTVTFSLE